MSFSWLPLLMPFLYICARTRIETLSVSLYYLAATWPVIPGAHNFFGEHAPRPMAYGLWLLLALFGTLPWVVFFHRRAPEWSALAALALLALPPLSLVTVGYPLTAAGIWFPGTAWVGLLAPCFLLAARRLFSMPWIVGLMAASSLIAHVFARVPQRDPQIVAMNTRFGGLGFDIESGPSLINAQMEVLRGQLDAQQKFIENAALAHKGSVVFFPEGAIRAYSSFIDQQWKPFLDQLASQHTTIVFGTTAPLPYTRAAYRNLLAQRGWTPDGRFAYVQRVPVPISMWKIGDRESGFPLLLQNSGAFKIRNQYAGVLMCYEQLLAWPALQTLAEQPDFLVAPRNVYFAKDTPIPAVQHQAAQSWADLWGIPLYEAQNE
jgi:hypothetical protein